MSICLYLTRLLNVESLTEFIVLAFETPFSYIYQYEMSNLSCRLSTSLTALYDIFILRALRPKQGHILETSKSIRSH